MDFSEHVLIVQLGKFRESDLWVRFLSPSRGLLTAFAFGGSRSRRRFVGCLDLFNEVHVTVANQPRAQYLTLQEGVLIRGVSRLRQDRQRLGMAINCIRFMQTFGVGPDGAEQSLNLMRHVLRILEEEETIPAFLPFFFRARLVFDNGYAIGTTRCAACSQEFAGLAVDLFPRDGLLLCSTCTLKQSGQRIRLSAEAQSMLTAIHDLPLPTWNAATFSRPGVRQLAGAIDGLIQYHVGIVWDNGRFIRH